MSDWIIEIAPIFLLLAVVSVVLGLLPKVEGVNHSGAFRLRRVMNWLPLGLTYAFLYMGRYNLKVSKLAFGDMPDPSGHPMMGNDDFGWIFAAGTLTYGVSFLINGPLTDRLGGKFAILMGTGGSALMNGIMGLATLSLVKHVGPYGFIAEHFVPVFIVLYALNMYFQSFGAVAVVKVNAPWFHLRERGVFGAIFGILISLGVYFAFDWGYLIVTHLPLPYVFFIPTGILTVLWVVVLAVVRNTPGEAGLEDFDLEDATEDGPALSVVAVFKKMLSNPIILTIAAVEFCSGFLRQSIMQWFREFAKQTDGALGLKETFVYEHWGLLLCCAGILGGVFAGTLSDHLFQSRRGPAAALLYMGMLTGAVVLTFTYSTPIVGWLVIAMNLCIIGVHGMLSGTASMDFGGKRNVGIAVGIIDGFVYLGTGVMSVTYALILPESELDAAGHVTGLAADPANWIAWPAAMVPVALVGLLLTTRLWNAKPKAKPPGPVDPTRKDRRPAPRPESANGPTLLPPDSMAPGNIG